MTSETIVIHVPLKSVQEFEVFRTEPFFSIDGSVMMLDLLPSTVLAHRDYTVYATGLISELNTCRAQHLSLHFLFSILFCFSPVTGGYYELVLTQSDALKVVEVCPYITWFLDPSSTRDYLIFTTPFFAQPHFASVVCPEGTTYKKVTGHLFIRITCFLRSTNLTTYPEQLHE